MVYDIFTFNNELDVLELRLNILNSYVDYFVIIEASETFSGVEKPLYFKENKDRYKDFEHKIIHYVVNDKPNNLLDIINDELLYNPIINDNYKSNFKYGFKEFYQKECIKKAIISLNDEDICYISDVDEIWNPNTNLVIEDGYYKFMLDYSYIEYLNYRNKDKWYDFTGTIVTKYKNIEKCCLGRIRNMNYMKCKYVYVKDGGWHFNAIGGINKKVDDWKHDIYTLNYMKRKTSGGYISENELPDYIKSNKDKYLHLFI